jgi:cytochrome oxidase Cu insertion factor (SCO1/SenC/PrrC family)
MKTKVAQLAMLLLTLAFSVQSQEKTSVATTQPAPPKTHLKVGQQAPDFTLTDTAGKPVKLADFRGKKNVVLAFYVLAFTGG